LMLRVHKNLLEGIRVLAKFRQHGVKPMNETRVGGMRHTAF
jgi:hypothetical protein